MSDITPIEQAPREEKPIIPTDGKIENWRNVYFHYSKADQLIPIIYKGLWSLGFSYEANWLIEPSGGSFENSPVQEEVGTDWISVFNSNHPAMPWGTITPRGENITFVLKQLPFKTKDTKAEKTRVAEKLIHWRVAPRDIIALWVDGDTLDMSIKDFLQNEISQDGIKRLRPYLRRLWDTNAVWRQMVKPINEKVWEETKQTFPGTPMAIKEDIHKTRSTQAEALLFLKYQYHLKPEQKVSDLLYELKKATGVNIYSVQDKIAKPIS